MSAESCRGQIPDQWNPREVKCDGARALLDSAQACVSDSFKRYEIDRSVEVNDVS